jgi:hypothetical protein
MAKNILGNMLVQIFAKNDNESELHNEEFSSNHTACDSELPFSNLLYKNQVHAPAEKLDV